MVELTFDEKKAYCERIEKKAREENVSFKHASQKLGFKVWAYYKYKADVRRMEREQQPVNSVKSPDNSGASGAGAVRAGPVNLSISVSDTVMCYLEKQADAYAFEPDIVAQILLHDCVNQKLKSEKAAAVLNNKEV